MADQNGTKNPWDSPDSQNAWNPSGAPTAHEESGEQGGSENSHESADSQSTAVNAPVTPAAPAAPAAPTAPTTQLPAQAGYSPAPEFGANTSNPTQPLPASSYPFGAPDPAEDKKSKQQDSQSGNSETGPRGLFGFGGTGNGQNGQGGQNGQQGQPVGQPGQQPQQGSGFFGAPQGAPNGGNGGPGNGDFTPAHANSNGSSRPWVAAIVSAIIAALLVVGLGYAGIANGIISLPQSSSASSLSSSTGGSGTAKVEGTNSPDWASVNKKVAKSVVSISVAVSGGVAKGSGAIIDTKGNIVTNNHVVEDAKQIQVTLNDGKTYSAKLVGTDSTTDLAVIKLENPPSDLQAVTFADSSDLAVGESIMAIGNPLGYENTATTGIVSALNRPVSVTDESSQSEVVTNAIQIDAAINPGNSGGPTFNAAGQVVGINSSIATASTSSSSSQSSESGSIGIGFAIPSNLVQRVAKQIVKSGKATHAQLGVTISEGSATVDSAAYSGAKINTVNSGGPAAKAGLKQGDVIIGFNGSTVSSMYAVLGYVRAAAVGDTVKLTVVRNSKTLDINVTLTEAESTKSSTSGNNDSNGDSDGNGSGNSDGDGDSDGNGGGLSDPFGLFGGQ
jgi:putative serine protease PepD